MTSWRNETRGHPHGHDDQDFRGEFRDPCAGIEADVSSLVDQELDQAGMRRVLVHLEVCPKCRGFLDSIRAQVSLHHGAFRAERGEDPFADGAFDGDLFEDYDEACAALAEPSDLQRSILEDTGQHVGEVLYQLGRAYIILARSPASFRIIAAEAVPVPEYLVRGRALLDGVSGFDSKPDAEGKVWAQARDLLDGQLERVGRMMDKGLRLLEESVAIRPSSNACRILLGQVHCELEHYERAEELFNAALVDSGARHESDRSTGVSMRVYALESLGNLCLWRGENERALAYFEEVRASGAMELHADFCSCLLNIAVASLRLSFFERAAEALEECYADFADRRAPLLTQLKLHRPMLADLEKNRETRLRLERSCPLWFGGESTPSHVSFHLESYGLDGDPRRRNRA